MNIKESADVFAKIAEDVNRYIAGGVVSPNRKVNPGIIFQKGEVARFTMFLGKVI